jgi:hypothetical protein
MTRTLRALHLARRLAMGVALAVPLAASAELNCERSVDVNAAGCQESVMPSVKQSEALAVCTAFRERLAARCKPSWDRFASCEEFSRRFADLLVATCVAKGVSEKACADWGNSFAVAPQTRCERKRTSY